MKKNNMGFFLAETIVVVALVTTVMAFVYPNVSKLYDTYKNRTNVYDQTKDIYALKAVYDAISTTEFFGNITEEKCGEIMEPGTINIESLLDVYVRGDTYNGFSSITILYFSDENEGSKIGFNIQNISDLKTVYIVGYMNNPENGVYAFNKYLKALKKTNYDPASYRLVGVFGEYDNARYASIKIDNPNANRHCNLGG